MTGPFRVSLYAAICALAMTPLGIVGSSQAHQEHVAAKQLSRRAKASQTAAALRALRRPRSWDVALPRQDRPRARGPQVLHLL